MAPGGTSTFVYSGFLADPLSSLGQAALSCLTRRPPVLFVTDFFVRSHRLHVSSLSQTDLYTQTFSSTCCFSQAAIGARYRSLLICLTGCTRLTLSMCVLNPVL